MSIIELAKFRKTKPKDSGLEFYCMKCNAGWFRIKAEGQVICGDCGSQMKNLKVECERLQP